MLTCRKFLRKLAEKNTKPHFRLFGISRNIFRIRQSVGDIRVTPYYVSHSAADAYMFVIECDGKKILHTGDFRDHGYLGKYLKGVLRKYVVEKHIDVLITEGTMLARNDERMMSEEDLQQRAYELMSGYKYVFVLCSSSDPDRLASFYHATVRHHDRLFLADGYQCKLMDAFTKSLGRRDRIYRFTEATEYNETMLQGRTDSGFTMIVRNSDKFRKCLCCQREKLSSYILSSWDISSRSIKRTTLPHTDSCTRMTGTWSICIHPDMPRGMPSQWYAGL